MSTPVISYSQFELRPQAEPRSDGQQRIQGEVFPFATLDLRNARLRDTKLFGSYRLCPAFGRNAFLDTDHHLGAHLENGRFIFIKAEIQKDIAAAFGDSAVVPTCIGLLHRSFSNQLVPPLRKLHVALARLLSFLLEGVKHVNSVRKLRNVDHAPGPIEVNPNLIGTFTHVLNGLEVHWHQSILHPEKLLAERLADLCRERPQIIPAAANEQNGLRFHLSNYINTYLKPTAVRKAKFIEMAEMQP